jgi:hypothetical protein
MASTAAAAPNSAKTAIKRPCERRKTLPLLAPAGR